MKRTEELVSMRRELIQCCAKHGYDCLDGDGELSVIPVWSSEAVLLMKNGIGVLRLQGNGVDSYLESEHEIYRHAMETSSFMFGIDNDEMVLRFASGIVDL